MSSKKILLPGRIPKGIPKAKPTSIPLYKHPSQPNRLLRAEEYNKLVQQDRKKAEEERARQHLERENERIRQYQQQEFNEQKYATTN
jgi:hypothetical protein